MTAPCKLCQIPATGWTAPVDNLNLTSFTNREIAVALIREMRARGVYGCVYMFPAEGGTGVFGSSSPAGSLAQYSAAQQLTVFAEVAAQGTTQCTTKLADIDATYDTETKTWVM